jgi:LysR family glycine cleavage system transcriptional activator
MLKDRNLLPPLDYLVAFESAASLESFTAAGRDLNVSESSISRKIRLLEQHFGCILFERGHRSVNITPKGKQLLNSIRPALLQLVAAAGDLAATNQKHTVTVAATHSAATLWLLPRLQQFNRDNLGIHIELRSSDNDEKCLADDVDLSILRGEGTWQNYRAQLLFGETVFPVCSPQYQQENISTEFLDDLGSHLLIDVSSEHLEWMNWRGWLQHSGKGNIEVDQSIVVNTYPLAIQAALDGFGIALGWKYLIDLHLGSGNLVIPWKNASVNTKSGYYLLVAQGRVKSPETRIVESWLLSLRLNSAA